MWSILTNTGTLNVFINSNSEFDSKYTFTEIRGRGSYSKVKLAYQNITHKKVAVKILEKA